MRWLLLAFAVALSVGLLLAGCGEDDDGAATNEATTETAPAPEPEPEPPTEPDPPPPVAEAGLPDYTAGFRDGLKLNAAPIPPSAGAPHGETKNVYVNQRREAIAPGGTQGYPYPDGSLVVKTGSRGGDEAAIVAIMRKIAGADPEHGDWQFTEFSRSAASEPYTVLARDSVCWTCHAGATDSDWVFTRLER
ncbi:MAG: cytochrome P460 family protein [Thermoleophilia bacterium]|nr:cytochrome P460 family protein [Thermoleophilia bacterium]